MNNFNTDSFLYSIDDEDLIGNILRWHDNSWERFGTQSSPIVNLFSSGVPMYHAPIIIPAPSDSALVYTPIISQNFDQNFGQITNADDTIDLLDTDIVNFTVSVDNGLHSGMVVELVVPPPSHSGATMMVQPSSFDFSVGETGIVHMSYDSLHPAITLAGTLSSSSSPVGEAVASTLLTLANPSTLTTPLTITASITNALDVHTDSEIVFSTGELFAIGHDRHDFPDLAILDSSAFTPVEAISPINIFDVLELRHNYIDSLIESVGVENGGFGTVFLNDSVTAITLSSEAPTLIGDMNYTVVDTALQIIGSEWG